MNRVIKPKLVWWLHSKVHVTGRKLGRTACGAYYLYSQSDSVIAWGNFKRKARKVPGLAFDNLQGNKIPPKVDGCKHCAMHLPAGYDF